MHSAEILAAAFALMFAFSAALKVGRWRSWAQVADMVVGDRGGAKAASVLVPLLEACVAVLAFALPAAGLAAAAATLALFAIVLAVRASDLAGSECGCFGAVLPTQIGPGLIWRNVGLSALAAAGSVLAASAGSAPPGPQELLVALLALTVGAAVIRRRDRGSEQHGPPIGSTVEIPGVGAGRPTVAVFLLPGCPSCEEAGPALAGFDSRHLDLTVIAAIGEGAPAERERLAAKLGPIARLDLAELRHDWGIAGAPFAVAVDRRGRVADAGFGASPAALERASRAALVGRVGRSGADERPLGVPVELGTRRQALATIGAAFAFSMVAGQAVGRRRPTRRLRRRAGPKPSEIEVKGDCQKFRDYELDEKICGNKASGGCTYYDGFFEHDNSQIGSKVTNYKEVVTTKGGVFCPNCAIDNPGKCFPSATECVSNCHGSIGSCSGTCSSRCDGEVCIEAVATQELTPAFHVVVLKWVPPKRSSKGCAAYAKSVNKEIRSHEVGGHLAHGQENVKDKNERLLKNKTARACAPTYGEAKAQIDAAMASFANQARQAFAEEYLADGDRYHDSPAGSVLKIDCKACGGGK